MRLTWTIIFFTLFSFGCASAPVKKDAPNVAAEPEESSSEPEEEEEDLTKRAIVKEKIIKYVEGVSKEAQDDFRKGLKLSLTSPPDYEGAIDAFEEAIDEDPGFLEAYTNLGKVYERLRKHDKAEEIYEKVLERNPDALNVKAYLGKISLVRARQALDHGNQDRSDKLIREAKEIFDTIIARDERNVAANNALALYWLIRHEIEPVQENIEEAERRVVDVLAVEPFNTEALNTRGLINLLNGNYKIAKWIFAEKVMRLDPNSPEAYTNLGVTMVRLKQLPMAVAQFKKAVKLDPDNLPARMNLAAIQLNWLDYEGASEQYKYILNKQPDNVEALIGLGSSFWGLLKFEDAVSSYQKALDLNPRRTEMLFRIGKLYESNLGKVNEAIEFYEKYMAQKGLGEKSDVGKNVFALKLEKCMTDFAEKQNEDFGFCTDYVLCMQSNPDQKMCIAKRAKKFRTEKCNMDFFEEAGADPSFCGNVVACMEADEGTDMPTCAKKVKAGELVPPPPPAPAPEAAPAAEAAETKEEPAKKKKKLKKKKKKKKKKK